MGKYWYLAVIFIDIALTNVHHFWSSSNVELQWRVWDISQAGRVCLIPLVMLLQRKLEGKMAEMVVVNYFAFAILDFWQTFVNTNKGFQTEEFLAFLVVNLIAYKKWK